MNLTPVNICLSLICYNFTRQKHESRGLHCSSTTVQGSTLTRSVQNIKYEGPYVLQNRVVETSSIIDYYKIFYYIRPRQNLDVKTNVRLLVKTVFQMYSAIKTNLTKTYIFLNILYETCSAKCSHLGESYQLKSQELLVPPPRIFLF